MAERRTLGQILMSFGRITEEDVERALDYQKRHGGYFGEALLALGLVSQEELEWGLASQFDLPYVFPEAGSIDPEAAMLVTPDWALANLTLPIMKTASALTVVVDSPIRTEAVDELQARTNLRIELALASASKIRELIRQVYSRVGSTETDDAPTHASLSAAFAHALDAGALRFGISVRGPRAWAWHEDRGSVRRTSLDGLWESELDQLLTPGRQDQIGNRRRAEWIGQLSRGSIVTPVNVRFLAAEGGAEYLFRPMQERSEILERFAPPSSVTLAEIRLLARSGGAGFMVVVDPPELGPEILPHLPALALHPSWRSVHVSDRDEELPAEVFAVRIASGDDELAEELEGLRAFHFDAVTVDLTSPAGDWIRGARDVASVAFVLWGRPEDRESAHTAGIRWELRIERSEGERLEWSLSPLKA